MSLEQCAQRFTTSTTTIKNILTAHDVQVRPASQPRTTGNAREEQPEVPRTALPESDQVSPLFHRLHRLGVDDSGLLARAAAIDGATADILGQVGGELLYDSGPTQKRSAADIAAADGPRTADAAVRSAAEPKTASDRRNAGNTSAKRPGSARRRRA